MQASNDNAVFEVGKRYYCRSICDHNCIWTFEVVSRTDRSVRIRDLATGKVTTRKIRTWSSAESCLPFGSYSMAPSLSADRLAA